MTVTNLRKIIRYFVTGNSSSTIPDDTDSLMLINSAYQQLVILAFSVCGDWQPLGDNSETTSITAGTRAYDLPSSLLKINRVDIKYPGTGDYVRARQIDYKKIDQKGLDEYTTSWPEFDLKEDKIEIFVSDKTASISAVSSGIIVYYEAEITELSADANEPVESVVPEPFSRLIALMAARDYCGVHGKTTQLSWIVGEIAKEEERFKEFMSSRSTAKRMRMTFKKTNYGQENLKHEGGQDRPSVNWS